MQGYNVILIYHHQDDAILMCKRLKDPYKGLYNLVGGKIEPNEDGLASAYRELKEETGIGNDAITLSHLMDFTYPLSDCTVKVYVGKLSRGVQLIEEAHPLYWIPLSENFFDLSRYAGEGNIGHMIEQVKLRHATLFKNTLSTTGQAAIWNRRYRDARDTVDLNTEQLFVKTALPYIEKMKDKLIVDLGCGDGVSTLFLHEHGYRVVACDFSSIALDVIQAQEPRIQTKCFDMSKELPFAKGSVGAILASLSTHYFTMQDTILLYARIHGALELGGTFIFRVNSHNEFEHRDKTRTVQTLEEDYYLNQDGTTKRYFTVASMTKLLKDFKIIRIAEKEYLYHGKIKYTIEGVAQKV